MCTLCTCTKYSSCCLLHVGKLFIHSSPVLFQVLRCRYQAQLWQLEGYFQRNDSPRTFGTHPVVVSPGCSDEGVHHENIDTRIRDIINNNRIYA